MIGAFSLFPEKKKVVIIDQLGGSYPNTTWVSNISKNFIQAGYRVDYIPSEEIKVNFFRELPLGGYKYIIVRAHSNPFPKDTIPAFREELTISTNELYNAWQYEKEQMEGRVAWFNLSEDIKYFGITSRFVESSMKGNFKGATIVLMGCNGLTHSKMAEAFIKKGAGCVIGWNKVVTLKHTDSTVEILVDNLINKQMEAQEAVIKVMGEFGDDPKYGSKLFLYQ